MMTKNKFTLVICRYHVVLVIAAVLIFWGIAVASRDAEFLSLPLHRYPYRIALTFDDGPHEGYTGRLISVLGRANVPATFFVVGSCLEQRPELARSLREHGHELGGHTMTHRNLCRLSEREIGAELSRTRELMRSQCGSESLLFRPPGGRYDEKVLAVARKLGLSLVLWTVFPRDHEENDPEMIVQRVLEQADDGGIILLHSGRQPTIEALPRIITALRQRGYRFVTVSELMKGSVPGAKHYAKIIRN